MVLDTTVLVYAGGRDSPFRDPCRRLLRAVGGRAVDATTTPEVIQEFCHVWARRRGRADAAARAGQAVDVLSPLMVVDEPALLRGLAIYGALTGLGSFDAVLAGAALATGASALVSADRAFAEVRGLRHVVPDEAGVTTLLADRRR